MLETENYRESNLFYEENYKRDYYAGMRLGMIISVCKFYRKAMTNKDVDSLSIFRDDTIEELDRFHNKYGKISYEKMAEHIVHESEYMVEME